MYGILIGTPAKGGHRGINMKKLLVNHKKYGFGDFLRIPFTVCPVYAGIKTLNQVLVSVLPSLQVLATAAFIDTALDIFAGKAGQSAITAPLLCLIAIVAYNNLNWQLMSYINLKMAMRLEFAYRTGIVEKRAALEYRHVEDNDTWELINRVCSDPVGKLTGGFDNILGAANIVLRVGSLLVILMAQVWWAGLAIVAISIPLFRLAIKGGHQIYEENKEAEKHRRRADYLKSVLQGRENVEERTLFGYTEKVNRQWLEKYEAARKISVGVSARYFVRLKGSSLITMLLSLLIIRRRSLPFDFSARDIRIKGAYIGQIMKLGTPIALQDLLVNISFLVIIAIVNSLGLTESAGGGVAEKMCGFLMLAPSAYMQSMSAFVAQNMGAEKPERARKALLYGIVTSLMLSVIMAYAGRLSA